MRKGVCAVIMNDNLDEIERLVTWVHASPKVDWIYFMSVVQPNNTLYQDKWQDEYSSLWPKDKGKVNLDRIYRNNLSAGLCFYGLYKKYNAILMIYLTD